MSTESTHSHPFPRNWSPQELTDAVPRRLSDLITPELMRFAAGDDAANSIALSSRALAWRRRDRDEPSVFRVR